MPPPLTSQHKVQNLWSLNGVGRVTSQPPRRALWPHRKKVVSSLSGTPPLPRSSSGPTCFWPFRGAGSQATRAAAPPRVFSDDFLVVHFSTPCGSFNSPPFLGYFGEIPEWPKITQFPYTAFFLPTRSARNCLLGGGGRLCGWGLAGLPATDHVCRGCWVHGSGAPEPSAVVAPLRQDFSCPKKKHPPSAAR